MSPGAGALRTLPASRIVASIADACARWSDADYPPRVRATRSVMERMRYSEPVVDYALDRLFRPVTVPALRAVIENELGAIEALDGFVSRPHRPDAFARGVDRVAIVSSDSTIGVALWPALFALCAKSDVTVKDRGDDLLAAFAETLAEEDPAFSEAFVAERWEGHDLPLAMRRLAEAGVVVAFGRNLSLHAIRERCRSDARFFGFGHRTSAGYVEREALNDEVGALSVARECARDALLYDGEGCLSLHAFFAEYGGPVSPARFAELLEEACAETSIEFPSARSGDSRTEREMAAFRAAQHAPPVRTFHIAFEPDRAEPPPLGARELAVYAVSDHPRSRGVYPSPRAAARGDRTRAPGTRSRRCRRPSAGLRRVAHRPAGQLAGAGARLQSRR